MQILLGPLVYETVFSGHSEASGQFIDVKINAPEVLKKQLDKAKEGRVWISSGCDPYQLLEARYGLTRRWLKELAKRGQSEGEASQDG